MSDLRTILERGVGGTTPPPDGFERMLRRRDRKRRNQRIAAGVVGIAVFVATVWVVATGGPIDRTETPAVPGPPVTEPTESPGVEVWLPPKGAEPSTPAEGQVVLQTVGTHPWHSIQVYADGRVIWSQQTGFTGNSKTSSTTGWLERRLTPEGVDLVRSGAIRLEDLDPPSHVPANAWEDPQVKPYVPSRYAVCAAWSQETMRLLPQRTQDLLRGHTDKQAVYIGEAVFPWLAGGQGVVACPEMTIEEARALDKIFLEAGFERSETARGLLYDIKARDVSSIRVIPLLPDGEFSLCCPA